MMPPTIQCSELLVGDGVGIADTAIIKGGRIEIRDGCRIGGYANIEVTERFVVGKGSVIGEHTTIRGRDINLGREFYSNHHAEIGGGSCFEKTSRLRTGYWCHLGSYTMVNTAMSVDIGNEVGMGRFTSIYTHGAYLSMANGFPVAFAPVRIGHRVWLPQALVNPGVTIGDDVVVGVGSVVTKDLPSGCLALGTPCRVVRSNAYPVPTAPREVLAKVLGVLGTWNINYEVVHDSVPLVRIARAEFDFKARRIMGEVSAESERARNLLRRHGIRFKVETESGAYVPWPDS